MQDDDLTNALDQLKHEEIKAPAYLAPRIVAQLPKLDSLDRFLTWISTSFWRGAVTALLPLVLGFAAGQFDNQDDANAWIATEALVYATTLADYDYDEI